MKTKREKFSQALQQFHTFSLDTMCFIYHFEGNEPYGPLTKLLFSHLEDQQLKNFTSVLTTAEIFANEKIQLNPLILARNKERLATMPGLTIIPVDFPLSERAASLRVQYNLPLVDALHLATAQAVNAEVFVTNDDHFKRVESPKVLILDDFV